ncbi:unnamed protein product [Paramecium primaurelia]|uniref:Uncharacterized protein n=1 Tax=Paramecium primaurelia TaxID=5886 RepID=A0A8S1LVH0_PARPR|nr:unnamed protein product [Paramecium primaurelia]
MIIIKKYLVEDCFKIVLKLSKNILISIIQRQKNIHGGNFLRINKELVNVFEWIQVEQIKTLSHSNYTDILIQIELLTNTYTQVIKIDQKNQNSEQFFQSIKELVEKVMKSLRYNICTLILKGNVNIEYLKEYLQNLQKNLKKKQSEDSTVTFPKTQNVDPSYMQNQTVQQVINKNGQFAYEATLQDGNQLLMHHNPNSNNELTFMKKINGNGENGYSKNWEKVGKPIQTQSVTVQELQQSIKGQSEKFNMQPIQTYAMNYQLQQAKIQGQLGGVIAGTIGSLTVDLIMDGMDSSKLEKGLIVSVPIQGGLIYTQSVQSFSKAVPYVGVGLTALMTSISVGGVILSDFLSQGEKVYNSMLIAIKTVSAIGLGYLGIEGGMALGATDGPIGIVIEASSNFFGRAIDHFTQFHLQVDFQNILKSKVENGDKFNPGILPKISWKYVKAKVRSLILIAQTDNHMACLIPNIDRNRTEIQENEDIGIRLNKYKYIGPDDSCKIITFRLLATTEEYVYDDEILQQLQTNEIKIIYIAQVKINQQNIKQL